MMKPALTLVLGRRRFGKFSNKKFEIPCNLKKKQSLNVRSRLSHKRVLGTELKTEAETKNPELKTPLSLRFGNQ